MDFRSAKKKLETIGQTHLLQFFDQLNEKEKELLLHQIQLIDIDFFQKQNLCIKAHLHKNKEQEKRLFTPLKEFYTPCEKDLQKGEALLKQQKIAAILVAGGQGTRLKFSGPKGLFPTSLIKQKTLFQLFAEKVLAASIFANQKLCLAIMTSPFNHKETYNFFKENHFFGLQEDQIDFFIQNTEPLLTKENNFFLEDTHTIAKGPTGNGVVFEKFYQSPIFKKWQDLGITYVNFIQIDNPLADPFDTALVGHHVQNNNEVTIKATKRLSEEEKVGVVVQGEKTLEVVEYSELSEKEATKRDVDNQLQFFCANLSLFCFNLSFIKKIATSHKMGWHLAFKAADQVDIQGVKKRSKSPIAWKFEKFVFDALPFSQKSSVLLYPREDCFAPLKNLEGNDSLKTVQKALLERDKKQFYHVTGTRISDCQFELSADFYYPTDSIKKKWSGQKLPDCAFIEA